MANLLRAIFHIVTTAFLVASLLLLAGYLLLQQQQKSRYPNRIEFLADDLPHQPPKHIILIDNRTELPNWKKESSDTDLLNATPMPEHLPPAAEYRQLPDFDYDLLSALEKRQLWKTYATPFNPSAPTYKVAVILLGLGQNEHLLETAAEGLPSNVGFAFSAYSSNKKESVRLANGFGHEAYDELIMPSDNMEIEDTGPKTNSYDFDKSVKTGGLVFVNKNTKHNLTHLVKDLKKSGLLLINATGKDSLKDDLSIPYLNANILIEEGVYNDELLEKLELAEHLAFENGQVIVAAVAKPNVIVALRQWVDAFNTKNMELVPVTALIREKF